MRSTVNESVFVADHRPDRTAKTQSRTRSRRLTTTGIRSLLLGLLIVFMADVRGARANGNAVDLALVLAIDISRSVNNDEYLLQRGGLAYAIRHPDVVAAIKSGQLKRIAVTVVQWSDYEAQVVVVPWMVISDTKSAIRFSNRVAKAVRFYGGHGTHVAGMIKFGAQLLEDVPFIASRKVIDISGDGRDNITSAPGRHRDDAVAAGITINGLAIENEEKDLRHYYRDYVIGGPGAFVIRTQRYKDYGDAMQKKLVREIAPKVLTTSPSLFDAG